MKSRLHKLKTTYDEEANIDRRALFEQTHSLHKEQVNYSKYSDTITDRNFALKPLQIGFVQSLALKDDIKFKQIKQVLQKYNEQVLFYGEKAVSGLHLKTVVMDSMLKFMRLMLMAPDITAKKRILDVAYYWFKKNLDPKSLRKPKQVLQNEIRQILLDSKVLPKALVQKQLNLPSLRRQEELMNYKIKARTNYTELDAPYLELQNYITHKVGLMQNNNKNQEEKQQNQKLMSKQQKWKNRVLFRRPDTYVYQHEKQEDALAEAVKLQLIQSEKLKLQNDKKNQGDKPTEQQLISQQNVVVGDSNAVAQVEKQVQQDFGVPQQNQPEEQAQVQYEEPQKKRGKLDPLVKIFLLDRQKRAKTQGEYSMDQKLMHIKNSKLQKQRSDSIDGKVIQNWAGGRSRFKSQLSRKIQSIRAFQRVRGNSSKQDRRPAQNSINKARFNETFDQCKDYLHKQPNREALNTQNSLSLYDKRRVNTEASWKPFSSILEQNKRLNKKSDYLDQIQDIKSKFAKYKLFTPLANLKNGILQHQQMQVDFDKVGNLSKQKMILPSGGLLSNPFAKFGKKKKKKGKKKK